MEDVYTSKKNKHHWLKDKHLGIYNWVWLLFFILFVGFLIAILVMVSVNLARENDLQSQINERTKGSSIFNSIRQYVSKESSYSQSYTFSRKYRLNNEQITNEKIQSIEDYIKSIFVEIKDPFEYIRNNNQFKNYILQGDLQIKTHDTTVISYYITSNLPLFSAIKFLQIELNEHSYFQIKKIFSLCTNERHSSKRCDKYIGKLYNDYYDVLNIDDIDENIDSRNNNKTKPAHDNIANQLKGHYIKKPLDKEDEENEENEFNETANIILKDYVNLLVFFMDENTMSVLNKTAKTNQKHKNSLGEIVFIIEPHKI